MLMGTVTYSWERRQQLWRRTRTFVYKAHIVNTTYVENRTNNIINDKQQCRLYYVARTDASCFLIAARNYACWLKNTEQPSSCDNRVSFYMHTPTPFSSQNPDTIFQCSFYASITGYEPRWLIYIYAYRYNICTYRHIQVYTCIYEHYIHIHTYEQYMHFSANACVPVLCLYLNAQYMHI